MIKRLSKDEKLFYERFMFYNTNEQIICLFRNHLPRPNHNNRVYYDHGLVIATRKNEWITEDQKKHPNTHPVQKYALVYGYDGTAFTMRQYWHGDLVPHLSHLLFSCEEGIPKYKGEERGGSWTVLDTFPGLIVDDLDDPINLALRQMMITIKKKERIDKNKLRNLGQDLESIALGLELVKTK